MGIISAESPEADLEEETFGSGETVDKLLLSQAFQMREVLKTLLLSIMIS